MTIEQEKRQFHRILYNAKATLEVNQTAIHCQVIDMSLKGCLLRFPDPWSGDIEHLYILDLQLSSDAEIKMGLTVSHVVGNSVGFKCEHIDIDSMSELRRLVELNLGDSELLERDLLSLVGNDTTH